jgi:hypothetical protein
MLPTRSPLPRLCGKAPAISFDAVKHLLLCRIEQRPARLDLENYPHLPAAQVATTAAADYLTLLSQAVG